ncbi:MAG: hypothetical protein Q4G11_05765, partial [Gallicola sp.]|nr:hypothetical protein [Gallicola sp.]
MRQFIRLLNLDIKRSIFNPLFVIAIIGAILLKYPGMVADFKHYKELEVLYFYFHAPSQGMAILYLLFVALPGTALFCQDINSNHFRSLLIRSSARQYMLAKIVSCILMPLLVVYLAEIVFASLFSLVIPLYKPAGSHYPDFLKNSHVGAFLKAGFWPFLFANSLGAALSASVCCLIALLISTKISNHLLTLFTPLLSYFYISYFQVLLGFPPQLILSG